MSSHANGDDRPLGLIELCRRVGGDSELIFQNLIDSSPTVQSFADGTGTEFRFRTTIVHPVELMNDQHTKIGLVVWMDRAKVAEAQRAFRAGEPVRDSIEAERKRLLLAQTFAVARITNLLTAIEDILSCDAESTLGDAMAMARDAIARHLDVMSQDAGVDASRKVAQAGSHPYRTADNSTICLGCGGDGVDSHWGHRLA